MSEPLYDLETQSWDKDCPCIRAMQLDPECPWHGRPEFRANGEYRQVMDWQRLQTEAAAQLAAEAVRLEGIQAEIVAHLGEIPEQLRDDLAHQKARHDEAVALVRRLARVPVGWV